MGWINLIFGVRALHNVDKYYANVINDIADFVEPTTTKDIITNETILTQYIIKQVLEGFGGKCEAAVQK